MISLTYFAVLLVASNSIEDRSVLNVEDTNNNEIGIEKRPALDIIIEANEKEGGKLKMNFIRIILV